MKKLLLVLLLGVILAAGAFADHPKGWGIGILGQYGGNWQGGEFRGGALSLKVPILPVFWGIGAYGHGDSLAVSVTGGFYIIEGALIPIIDLHYFLGAGLYANFIFDDDVYYDFGGRLPIGLSWHLLGDFLELFAAIVPSIGIKINPVRFPAGGYSGELGFRIWL